VDQLRDVGPGEPATEIACWMIEMCDNVIGG
jgi:hypothetical protein